MSVPAEQMPPQGEMPQDGAAPASKDLKAMLAELGSLPPEIKLVVMSCMKVIDQRGEEIVGTMAEGAKSIAIGLSQAAFALLMGAIAQLSSEAEAEVGEKAGINPGDFVGDAGPAELVLARLFGVAEEMGLPGADDQSEYVTAGDALDLLLEIAESGGGEGGDPGAQEMPADAEMAPQAAPPQAAPPQGWRSGA